jgi:glycine cleavage system H protein
MSEFYQFAVDKFIFRVKKGLLYSKDDVWVKIEGNQVRIGVTDFLQMSGGDILFVELPKVGSKVKHLEAVAQFETIKEVYEVVSPFGGTVAETN